MENIGLAFLPSYQNQPAKSSTSEVGQSSGPFQEMLLGTSETNEYAAMRFSMLSGVLPSKSRASTRACRWIRWRRSLPSSQKTHGLQDVATTLPTSSPGPGQPTVLIEGESVYTNVLDRVRTAHGGDCYGPGIGWRAHP